MRHKFLLRFVGLISAFSGIGIIIYVVYPILSFQVADATRFESYLSPIPEASSSVEYHGDAGVDYTKASNWFAGAKHEDFEASNVRYYTLSIPKLRIKNATVAIGGEDLSDSLVQYPGTALPGKRGNAVIFGHSILPQFYNPKNYLSIFSTLNTLSKGDELDINYDGIEYHYLVEDLFEVKPTDIEILAQNASDSFTTLVTCTPPGDPFRPRRLIVRARLDPYGTLSSANYDHTGN